MDLRRGIVEPVLALEFAADRSLELRDTVDCRVFRLAVADCGDAGLFDVVRRVEIGLPDPEADHVAPLGRKIARKLCHGDRGRGLDPIQRFGQKILR